MDLLGIDRACFVAVNALFQLKKRSRGQLLREISHEIYKSWEFIRFMEIYRLAKFLSISLKLGDFHLPPTLPPFSSSN